MDGTIKKWRMGDWEGDTCMDTRWDWEVDSTHITHTLLELTRYRQITDQNDRVYGQVLLVSSRTEKKKKKKTPKQNPA